MIEMAAEEYCESVRDGTHDSPKFHDSGYPLITSKAIKEGSLIFENAGLVSEKDFTEINKRSEVHQWDILFTMIGTLGEVYLEKSDEIGYAIKNVGLFKCGTELKAKWLYYWFRSPDNKRAILQLRRGASQQYLPLGTLRSLKISFPDDENYTKRVVELISAYDDLIENNKRRIELLEESARQLYKEWFVRFRFPGHEHVKIVDGVPEGWEKKTLKELLTLNYGKALKADNRIPGDFPVYGSSGVVGSHNKSLVKGPGIIVGRKGNVGSIHWSHIDFFPIDTVYFIANEESSYFIYYALLHTAFTNTDVAVPGLNRDFAYSREILVPTVNLRKEFEDEVSVVFKQIHTLEKYNDQLSKARDLLLPKLMSVEIAV